MAAMMPFFRVGSRDTSLNPPNWHYIVQRKRTRITLTKLQTRPGRTLFLNGSRVRSDKDIYFVAILSFKWFLGYIGWFTRRDVRTKWPFGLLTASESAQLDQLLDLLFSVHPVNSANVPVWKPHHDGIYDDNSYNCSSMVAGVRCQFYKAIWKAAVPENVKIFSWLVFAQSLWAILLTCSMVCLGTYLHFGLLRGEEVRWRLR